MQALFSPAVALMNRIRYNTKFLLIGGAVTLVILVLLSSVLPR
jgi:methyl-accepting chemotaxis protein